MTLRGGSAILGVDYSSPSNVVGVPVNFAVGDTVVTVSYAISTDTLIEDTETFTLDLTLAGTTSDSFATILSPSFTTVYIIDCTGR